MNRLWSILFFLVPILAIGTYLMAQFNIWPFQNAWMPENFSEAGSTIDHLFNVLHGISAVILIGTGMAIGWILWRYDHRRVDKAQHIHHHTKLEIVWSVIPGMVLVFLAFYQMNSWAENKMNRPEVEPLVLVKAKQFGWEFHYAGADNQVQTRDDVYLENLLVVPVGEDIVLQLESLDVIHSFAVPKLRIKQDIVPGMAQYTWFRATKTGEMEVMCTELCGWGHYKMKAQLKIVSRPEYDRWIAEQTKAYHDAPSDDDQALNVSRK